MRFTRSPIPTGAVVPGGRLRCLCATCGYPGLWDPERGVVVHWHRRCQVAATG